MSEHKCLFALVFASKVESTNQIWRSVFLNRGVLGDILSLFPTDAGEDVSFVLLSLGPPFLVGLGAIAGATHTVLRNKT